MAAGRHFFLSAVAGRVTPPGPEEATSVDTFVTAVLKRATDELQAIETRIGMALVTTYVAVAVTMTVLILALVTASPTTSKHGSLALTTAGSTTMESLCGGTRTEVKVHLDPGTLGDLFTEVKLDSCGTPPKVVTLRLAKRDIAGFAVK